jgi:pimeloyl-ACP methyl ester carboxylesterase
MHQLTTDDGLNIVFDVWGERDADGRPPVVLHHGFAADTFVNWVRPGLVDALVGAGHHVVSLDARGHGRSDKPHDATRYGTARMARDVELLVDQLGFEQYQLVGYSMGAIVSGWVGAGDTRVARLVLGGIGGGVVDPELRAARMRRMTRVVDGLEATDDSEVSDASGAAFRAFARSTGADLGALAAVARSNAGNRERMPVERITAPTLVVVGEDDALAGRAELLASSIQGASLQIVPGDHLSAVATPELCDALVKFLA